MPWPHITETFRPFVIRPRASFAQCVPTRSPVHETNPAAKPATPPIQKHAGWKVGARNVRRRQGLHNGQQNRPGLPAGDAARWNLEEPDHNGNGTAQPVLPPRIPGHARPPQIAQSRHPLLQLARFKTMGTLATVKFNDACEALKCRSRFRREISNSLSLRWIWTSFLRPLCPDSAKPGMLATSMSGVISL